MTIDLDAVEQNLQTVRSLAPGRKVMAVIKADAYGHGAIAVAKKLTAADAFAVGRISEAVKLREAGIGNPICLLEGVLDKEELNLASVYEFQVVVHSDYQLDLLKQQSARRQIWIKVDTGMGRLGLSLDELKKLERSWASQSVLGYMTHLADAGSPDSALMEKQLGRIDTLRRLIGPGKNLNIANSAAILRYPNLDAAWVRPGLMLYGASPMEDLAPISSLYPAMTFTAPVIAVRSVKQGESVGYGGLWIAKEDTEIAVIAAGYADGYPREISAGAPVLLGGDEVPLIGRVSMDMICVRLAKGHHIAPGDRATLWGAGLPIERVAACADTVPYTLMSGVTARVPRFYRGGIRRG